MADQHGHGAAVTGARSSRRRRELLGPGLLLGFAALIGKLFVTGQITRYMAPALDPLTALAGIVMGVMGVVGLASGARGDEHHAHAADPWERALTIMLVILPIALGLLVTPRALGAGALGGERVTRLLLAYAPGPLLAADASPPAPSRPIADTADVVAYLQQAGVSGAGQRVRATGLAVSAETLGAGEFALLRYAIAHCVADARPLVLLVAASAERAAATDQWVEVEGVLSITERDGARLVTIKADRTRPIPEPPNPYLGSSF
jgi:uncharacterized repeat protein (TIGR03943 family)